MPGMTFVSPCWTCFFGLVDRLEVRVYEECCLCATAEVAAGEMTPLPWLGHHEGLTAALNRKAILLMQVEYVLALEVTQALLTKKKSVSRCRFPVSHERGDVFDSGIMTTSCSVVGAICPTISAVEKIAGVGVGCAHVELGARIHFIIQQWEEIETDFEFVFDGRDLVVGGMVLDLLETLFGEEALVAE